MTGTMASRWMRAMRGGASAAVAGGLLLAGPQAVARQAAPLQRSTSQAAVSGQEGAHARGAERGDTSQVPEDAHDAAAPAPGGAHAAEEAHGESVWVTLARFANFAILAGLIYWFGRGPLAAHLASRREHIRRDLVEAAAIRQVATARLAEIDQQLQALPGEIEQLKARAAEELEAERTRMRRAGDVERDRLLEQARREIANQTRNAKAELRAHAATLVVDVAEARLRGTLTPGEQAALVDGYAAQMRSVQ